MNPELEIARLLDEDGADLVRQSPHRVWRLSSGRNFVRAKTPSDLREPHKSLAVLRRLLGLTGHDGRGREGKRRAYRHKRRAPAPRLKLAPSGRRLMSLADQLAYLATVEELERTRAELAETRRHYEAAQAENERLCEVNTQLESRECRRLCCRLTRW